MKAWPFVGRESELAELERLVVEEGGAFLTGPMGVGKSRLLRELLTRQRAQGHRVFEITGADAASALPLASIAVRGPLDGVS